MVEWRHGVVSAPFLLGGKFEFRRESEYYRLEGNVRIHLSAFSPFSVFVIREYDKDRSRQTEEEDLSCLKYKRLNTNDNETGNVKEREYIN